MPDQVAVLVATFRDLLRPIQGVEGLLQPDLILSAVELLLERARRRRPRPLSEEEMLFMLLQFAPRHERARDYLRRLIGELADNPDPVGAVGPSGEA